MCAEFQLAHLVVIVIQIWYRLVLYSIIVLCSRFYKEGFTSPKSAQELDQGTPICTSNVPAGEMKKHLTEALCNQWVKDQYNYYAESIESIS